MCLIEGATIDLDGTISREAFPGPPNYRSIDRGDAADIVFIITSGSPYDICEIDPETRALRPIGQVRRFQLFKSPDLSPSELPVVFGTAHVRGAVTMALSDHYHTLAAVEVFGFENVGVWSAKASPPPTYGSVDVPVTITFRRALLGFGRVARIKNQSDQTLSLLASIANRTSDAAQAVAIVVPPHRTKEIGRFQGWDFASGDRLLLHNDLFTDVAVHVP
jgi:hypothetical protein